MRGREGETTREGCREKERERGRERGREIGRERESPHNSLIARVQLVVHRSSHARVCKEDRLHRAVLSSYFVHVFGACTLKCNKTNTNAMPPTYATKFIICTFKLFVCKQGATLS